MISPIRKHGRDHRPDGQDPMGPWDSTATAGTNYGVRSKGPVPAGYTLQSDGNDGSVWGQLQFFGSGGGLSGASVSFPTQSNVDTSAKWNFPGWLIKNGAGDLLAFYEIGTSETSTDFIGGYRKSTDGGNTWGAFVTIAPSMPSGINAACVTSTGRILVSGGSGTNDPWVMYSDDDGATWSSTITLPKYSHQTFSIGNPLQHSSGVIVQGVYGSNTGDTGTRNGVVRSTDNGLTWGSIITIGGANTNYNEFTLVELPDTTIQAYIRKDPGGNDFVHVATSTDAGLTWSPITSTGLACTPGLPLVMLEPDTQALVLFYRQPTTEIPLYTYSFNYGATWATPVGFSASVYEYAGGGPIANNLLGFIIGLDVSLTHINLGFASMRVTPGGAVSGAPVLDVSFTAKGDIPVGTGANAFDMRHVGADNTALVAASGQADGVNWAAVANSVFGRTGAVVATNADYYGIVAAALTGVTGGAARFVGSLATGGTPASGTFLKGDFLVGQDGTIWICTTAGTPGTWTQVGSGGGAVSSVFSRTGAVVAGNADYLAVASGGLTGATQATRFVGGTTSGHPTTGTFAVGDFAIDQSGSLWICITAGTPGTWVALGSSSGNIPSGGTAGQVVGYGGVSGTGAWVYGPIGSTALVYRYTVSGSDKASIDTGVDTANAGTNDWTNGDVLEVFMQVRTDDAGAGANISVNLNNDSGSNYDVDQVQDTNGTVTGVAANVSAWSLFTHGSGGSANYASAHRLIIPNFGGTTFFKTAVSHGGVSDATGSNNFVQLKHFGYRSTAAITRLKVAAGAGQKLKVGSQLLIYKRLAS